ncbi:MAG: hypothetical protein ABW170_16830 [Candidatus Thiodiazotropha sp. L084R]
MIDIVGFILPPPPEAIVLWRAKIPESVTCVDYDGNIIPPPNPGMVFEIFKYDNYGPDDGVLLISLNKGESLNEAITDSWHKDVTEAKNSAAEAFEGSIQGDKVVLHWEKVSEES